jgi:hypothetical protein
MHSPSITNVVDDAEAAPADCPRFSRTHLRDAKRTVLDFDPCRTVRIDDHFERGGEHGSAYRRLPSDESTYTTHRGRPSFG